MATRYKNLSIKKIINDEVKIAQSKVSDKWVIKNTNGGLFYRENPDSPSTAAFGVQLFATVYETKELANAKKNELLARWPYLRAFIVVLPL